MTRHAIFSSLCGILFFSLQAAENGVIAQQPKQIESEIGRFTPAEELCGLCAIAAPVNTAVAIVYASATHSPTMAATICKTTACLSATQATCGLYALCCASLFRTTDDKNK